MFISSSSAWLCLCVLVVCLIYLYAKSISFCFDFFFLFVSSLFEMRRFQFFHRYLKMNFYQANWSICLVSFFHSIRLLLFDKLHICNFHSPIRMHGAYYVNGLLLILFFNHLQTCWKRLCQWDIGQVQLPPKSLWVLVNYVPWTAANLLVPRLLFTRFISDCLQIIMPIMLLLWLWWSQCRAL